MELIAESVRMEDYLRETEEVDFSHRLIGELRDKLFHGQMPEVEIAEKAYLFVRDEISHSWYIRSTKVTRTASEVLLHGEGICYAKSNLLAALLRSAGIPAGFCYQRLTLGDTPESGYCLHALNGAYVSSAGKWIRLDARGNKAGIDARFGIEEERLAFPVRSHYGEIDYPAIFAEPNRKTMDVLWENADCLVMYAHRLPAEL